MFVLICAGNSRIPGERCPRKIRYFLSARSDFSRFADRNGPGDRAENPPLAPLVVTKPEAEVRTIQLPLARTEESDYRSP